MDFVRRLFGLQTAEETAEGCRAAGRDGRAVLAEVSAALDELDAQVKRCEAKIDGLEADEQQLREAAEALLMASHDGDLRESMPDSAREALRREAMETVRGVEQKREDVELRLLKLQLRRAELVGQQRKAEHLLSDLGQADASGLVTLDGRTVPEYPNVVRVPVSADVAGDEDEEDKDVLQPQGRSAF